ncbi:FAD binding domain-containing protein [Jatrophihabitans sp.]|uniref:FAD binding domain-containing protein n=1 Tax=Jatrophihabitans sp. TaxID=1932789 RepID=UPI002BC04F5C|nr:FAD binding domain-containing protein [Jatrophihabitans sp.]
MKPPAFDYSRPESLDEALDLLAGFGPDAKVLAGGQSLLPLLSMRLAAPSRLVDVNRLAELAYVRSGPDAVRVGALARHAAVLHDAGARDRQPLLAEALAAVAHPTIRNRGTSVGSLVHADPAAELPAVLCLLGGSVTLASTAGRRTVPAGEFFLGPLESAVRPGELAVEASFPALGARSGTAFLEVSRRHGDYAVCGVAVLVELDSDLRIATARAGYLSVAPTPLVLDLTGAAGGRAYDADYAGPESAVAALVRDAVDPEPDIHASAAYRRQLAGVLTARALGIAARRAAGAAAEVAA